MSESEHLDKGDRTVEIQVTTIDRFVAEMGLSQLSIIKIDVEGFELNVLQGAEKLLERANAPIILLETHPVHSKRHFGSPKSVANYLAGLDFEIFVLNRNTKTPLCWRLTDELAAKQEKLSLLYNLIAIKGDHPSYGKLRARMETDASR